MAYIGKQPTIGNFQVCDAISVVNGQAAYTMQVSSVNVVPETANHMIVSLNGIIQKPGSSFTVSGSTITFASNLVTGDVIDFIHILGSVLDLGVPSDDTVSTAKISANAVTAAKFNADVISGQTALATEPADTDEFLVSDAGVLKRIDYSLIKGGGGLVHIKTQNITSGVASVDFAHGSSDVIFDSTYNAYKLIISDMKIATDGQKPFIKLSNDAGSSFIGSGYHVSGQARDSNGGGDTLAETGNADIKMCDDAMGNDTTASFGAEIYFHKPSTSDTTKIIHGTYGLKDQNTYFVSGYFGGTYNGSGTTIDGFQIKVGSGNITRGNFSLFGVVNS
jgi:hypothetical protein